MTEFDLFLAESWRGLFGGDVRWEPGALDRLGVLPDEDILTAAIAVLGGRGDEMLLGCPMIAARRLSRSLRNDATGPVSAEAAADAVREAMAMLAGGAKAWLGIEEPLGPPQFLEPGRWAHRVDLSHRSAHPSERREGRLVWDSLPVYVAWIRLERALVGR